MSSPKFLLQVTVLAFCLAEGAESTVLSTSERVVEVNTSVTLNCSSVYGEAEGARYYIQYQTGESLKIFLIGERCTVFGINNIPMSISFFCFNARLFVLELHNVKLAFHNCSVYCETYKGTDVKRSANVVMEVAVPVTHATILPDDVSAPLTTIEYNATHLTCRTSPSYPAPKITWYRNSGITGDVEINHEVTIQCETNGSYHLISKESTLRLNASRTFNGSSIFCTASNGFGYNPVVRSSKLKLLVQYPPSKPKFHVRQYDIEKTVNVIKENALSIGCRSEGYPPPSFLWIHKGTVISTGKMLTIPSTNETHNGTYVCKVNNTMKWSHVGQNDNEISVTVLIPASRPKFYFNTSSGNVINNTLYAVKNDSFTVICKSTGVPMPVIGWNDSRVTNGTRTEMLVQEDFYRTCIASNELIETFGENRYISVKATLDVEVFYPPREVVIQLHYYSEHPQDVTNTVTIAEFSSFNLTCSARSKPDVSNYNWSGQVASYSNKVTLQNISRHEGGLYTCHASNVMLRSFGKEQIGQCSKAVLIDVLYASQVTEFFVSSHKEDNPAIANQRGNATLQCNVDSNPSSSIGLQFKDKLLINDTDTKNLTYAIRNISCSNAGIYNCFSFNKINSGKSSRKQLTLIVKCPPLPENDLNVKVTSLKYVPAILRFKARDFLDSQKTSFTWQKENNASQWESVKHDTSDVNISTFNMQTNLTIANVTEAYSGNYRVVYNNSVGGNTQMFTLSVADLPDTPQALDYLKHSLTSTQVSVVWTKGYGGGLKQTFVLSLSHRSQTIRHDYINETENTNMEHTITGLSSGTQYQVTLWSTNLLGKSLSQTITIITKELEVEATSILTAAVVGSVSGLLAVTAGVLVVFLLNKRRYQKKKNSSNGKRTCDDSCDMNTVSVSYNVSRRDLVYEGLKPNNERSCAEMKEQTYDILKKKQEFSDTKDPIYTNLQLW